MQKVPINIGGFAEIPDYPVSLGESVPSGEPGTWLPIIGGTGGESGQAYRYQHGYSSKTPCGAMWLINLWGYLQLLNKGIINGTLVFKGLPYRSLGVSGFFSGSIGHFSNLAPSAALASCQVYMGGGSVQADILGVEQGKYMNPRRLVPEDINNGSQFIFSLSYLMGGD